MKILAPFISDTQNLQFPFNYAVQSPFGCQKPTPKIHVKNQDRLIRMLQVLYRLSQNLFHFLNSPALLHTTILCTFKKMDEL